MKSHYETLGVEENATQEEIKKVWKELSKKWHPDNQRDPSQKEEMNRMQAEINEAYTVLSDPVKRANYDQYGSDTKPVSIDDLANMRVEELFMAIISNQNFQIDSMFILAQEAMIETIQTAEQRLNNSRYLVGDLKSKITRFEHILTEKLKDGMDHLKYAVTKTIHEIKQEITSINIPQLEIELEVCEKALEILTDLYPKEPEPKFENPLDQVLSSATDFRDDDFFTTYIKSKAFWWK